MVSPGPPPEALRTPDGAHGNLPHSLTRFVGRADEIAELSGLVTTERLVTLAGPAGSGKTRLALQVAAAVPLDLPDGRWLVELAGAADGELVPQLVVQGLGLRRAAASAVDDLVGTWRERRLL